MLLLTALFSCNQQAETPEPVADDPCPEISLEGLEGDWVKVSGSQADHTYRVRIFKEGDGWGAWYVGGGFKKVAMKGELRTDDLVLTAEGTLGADPLPRLYFQPHKPKCAMRVVEVKVKAGEDGAEKETQVGAGYVEWLSMPPEPPFTYRPCDDQAYVAKAATDWKVAKKEEAEGVNPVAALGEEVPVTAWSVAADDGDEACTYDMDLYFDDRPVEGAPVAAGEVNSEGRRAWPAVFRAPYSGNHHFEMYRHRTCDGGARELVAVSCIEAILD
jgi:hypothetical protein